MDNRPYEEPIIRRGSEQGTRLGRPPAWAQVGDSSTVRALKTDYCSPGMTWRLPRNGLEPIK